MKLTIRTFVAALLVATFALFGASPAFAQGPTLTADPVAAAGENTGTITESGFPADLAGFMFPCADAGSAEEWIAAPTADVCDTGALVPVTVDADGNFSADITLDVPDGGTVVGFGDAAQTIASAVDVVVGGGDAAAEEAAPAEEPADADLAQTGVETPIMVGLGVVLLGAGIGATRAGRRLGDR